MSSSKPICTVLSGAGISVESGLSTFRGDNGLWAGHRIEDVCQPDAFARNPKYVLDFYNQLRRQIAAAQPNEAHRLLANWQHVFKVNIVTQNIDDLHERAGSLNVLHLHGEINKARSSVYPDEIVDWSGDITLDNHDSSGNLLRPHIVWFGEAVPMLDAAIELVRQADIFLIIGTSLQVYPANTLLHFARPNIPVFVIDPEPISYIAGIRYVQQSASHGLMAIQTELFDFARQFQAA